MLRPPRSSRELSCSSNLLEKYCNVTNQNKATEKYFLVVLFIMLYDLVLTFASVEKILIVSNEMKAIEFLFSVPFLHGYENKLSETCTRYTARWKINVVDKSMLSYRGKYTKLT